MNEKNLIILFIIILFGMFGLLWVARGDQVSIPSQGELNIISELTAPEVFHDFGTISMAKGVVAYSFNISNGTGSDINLESVRTSCMCTTAYVVNGDSKRGPYRMPGMGVLPKSNELIKSGESRDIEVVYDPAAHGPAGVGQINRFVYLSDSDGGTIQLEIKAMVTP